MASSRTTRRPAAGEAWTLMLRLLRENRHRFHAVAAEFELSPPQVHALSSIEPGRPIPMSRLATVLQCDNSNVTGIVDRLEARGLVERRAAAHDRRVKHLHLTAEGEQVRSQVEERMAQAPEALTSLPAADQRALRDLLRRALAET